MVCNKTKIRIIGISALVLGLYCLQMSDIEHISKQQQLASMEVENIDASIILQEESVFEKRIRNYEYAALASIAIFFLCFFTVPFVKGRIQ
jgi:hypothetical protein